MDSAEPSSEDSDYQEESQDEESSLDEDASSLSEHESNTEAPLTDDEIQHLIDELLLVESKAAEAQEALEEECLSTLREEIRAELAESRSGSQLDAAIEEETSIYIEEWKDVLDGLEEKSSLLQEQLDNAGICLPYLFKWLEKQAPEGCTTEAWRKRTHWAGLQPGAEVIEAVNEAEADLQLQRPVKRRHGKLMEEGASGFLKKKLKEDLRNGVDNEGWESFNAIVDEKLCSQEKPLFGSKIWASVYTASTPEQAALLGVPGAEQVDELEDIEGCEKNPLYRAAVISEKESGLTEQQKRNVRKLLEEDDIKKIRLFERISFRRQKSFNKTRKRTAQDCSNGHKRDSSNKSSEANLISNDRKLVKESINVVNDGGSCGISTFANVDDPAPESSKKRRVDSSCVDNAEKKMKIGTEAGNENDSDHKELNAEHKVTDSMTITDMQETPVSNDIKLLNCEIDGKQRFVIDIESDEDEDNGDGIRNIGIIKAEAANATAEYSGERNFIGEGHLCTSNVPSGTTECCKGECLSADNSRKDNVSGKSSPQDANNRSPPSHATDGKSDTLYYACTCCSRALKPSKVQKHPLFDMTICKDCKSFYLSAPFSKDSDGTDMECSWCGNGGSLVLCEVCEKGFCQKCIELNFGKDELERILQSEWICFHCDSTPLKPFIDDFRNAKASSTYLSSENEDNSSGDEDMNKWPNERKGMSSRKRIRRIIDDDELNEETKHKLMEEKERLERLERLRDVAIVAEEKGIAINVIRDVEEKEILISASISRFLKPHQVQGIRFMWENCIVSVKDVKNGGRGNGCILAHNMGLGKTLQVIAFLCTVLNNRDLSLRTALIVTPVNVLHNWPVEFQKWKPEKKAQLQIFIFDDLSRDTSQRMKLLRRWQTCGGVMIIGYTAFRNLSSGKQIKYRSKREKIFRLLQNPGPDILICDEAHMIKNRHADITQALKQVRTQRRIALTGSPLQNNLMEYYCMVDFVREGFLGRPQDFRNRFENPIENGQHADSTEYDVKLMKQRTHVLHKQLSGFVQRIGASVVQNDLPTKQVFVISVRLSNLQRALYNRFIQRFWISKVQESSLAKTRKCMFTAYHVLSKIWNHPDILPSGKEEKDVSSDDSFEGFIVDDGYLSSDEGLNNRVHQEDDKKKSKSTRKRETEGLDVVNNLDWCSDLINPKHSKVLEESGKMVILMDIITMSSSRGDKVLVFSQSLATLDFIEVFLGKLSRPGGKSGHWRKDKEWYRLDGGTRSRERQRMVHSFNNPCNTKVQCLLISTRAGSLGINLQAANRVVIFDGSWNPTHDIQALFRAWRFGQTKPVVAYRLLAHGTAEEKIYKRQVVKEGLAARVLDEQQVGRHSKMEELKNLFKLDDENDGSSSSTTPPCNGLDSIDPSISDDDLMASLVIEHRPRWIVKIHEHDTLLEEIEDEKLTKEEQASAWESFRRGMEVEWVQLDSRKGEYLSSQVQNSWKTDFRRSSQCGARAHIEMLTSQSIPMGATVKCPACQNDIGWEDVKAKSRVRS